MLVREYGDKGVGEPLRFVEIENATVIPTAISSSNGSVRGGIVGTVGAPEFIHQRRGAPGGFRTVTRLRHDDPTGRFDLSSPNRLPGTSLYLGPLHRHFGHFVTESVTRLWYALAQVSKFDRVIALPEVSSVEQRENFTVDSLAPWQQDLLTYLGARDPFFVSRPVRCERLIVPEQQYLLFSEVNNAVGRRILASHAEHYFHTPATSHHSPRVFLGRPDIAAGGVAGESYLGEFLANFGYDVIRPETLPILQQLAAAYSAERVVATQGSALHLFNLLGETSAHALVIRRTTRSAFERFTSTVRPHFRSLTSVRQGSRLSGKATFHDLRLIDVGAFLRAVHAFDATIDPSAFDWAEFWRAARGDIEHWSEANQRPA